MGKRKSLKMKIKIFKPRPKVYERLINPKPRTGLIRRQNIEAVGNSRATFAKQPDAPTALNSYQAVSYGAGSL
jgi:hypothetical protein